MQNDLRKFGIFKIWTSVIATVSNFNKSYCKFWSSYYLTLEMFTDFRGHFCEIVLCILRGAYSLILLICKFLIDIKRLPKKVSYNYKYNYNAPVHGFDGFCHLDHIFLSGVSLFCKICGAFSRLFSEQIWSQWPTWVHKQVGPNPQKGSKHV